MPRFFVRADAIQNTRVRITGEDAVHISRSLRMRPGEEITVCDMQGREYQCRLHAFSGDRVDAEILSVKESENEPPYLATLYMALPKGDKMDYIVQKSVELGVTRIVPFASSRCVVKPDAQGAEKKRNRWQKIADAAAGQCGRAILPQVASPRAFADALSDAAGDAREGGLSFFCYEGADARDPSLSGLLSTAKATLFSSRTPGAKPRISFFIGAEGGFSVEEAEKARAAGLPAVGLGKRILRCETAPLFVLSCLLYTLELPNSTEENRSHAKT